MRGIEKGVTTISFSFFLSFSWYSLDAPSVAVVFGFSFLTAVTNIWNLLFRKKWTRNADSFDAHGIFKQFGSEEWGEYLIREAHLSQRFTFDENGYYHCCASIPFPENMQVD